MPYFNNASTKQCEMYYCTIDNFPGNGAKMLGTQYASILLPTYRVYKIYCQPEKVFYFKAIVQNICKYNFYLTLLIYWYAIETLCKLDHICLKRNQCSNLFINQTVNRIHFNKIYSYETRSDYVHLKNCYVGQRSTKWIISTMIMTDLMNESTQLWWNQWMKAWIK